MKFLTLIFAIFTVGCMTSPSYKNIESVVNTNLNQLDNFYNEGKVGKLKVFKDVGTVGNVEIKIFGPATPLGTTGNSTYVGKLSPNQGFQIYLPPGEYMLSVEGDYKNPLRFITLQLLGGTVQNYNIVRAGSHPVSVDSSPSGINWNKKGSIYFEFNIINFYNQFLTYSRPQFEITTGVEEKNIVPLYISLQNPESVKKVLINNVKKPHVADQNLIVSNQKVKVGSNSFKVEIVNDLGNSTSKEISFYIESLEEIQARKAKERADVLRLANIEKQRIAELERVTQEGDDSPDDVLCKRYGFMPNTKGYAHCRMQIDLAKAEAIRQNEQYEREKIAYNNKLVALERERQRKRSLRQLEFGLRLLGGQQPNDALNSIGTGAPIAPRSPQPIEHIITLPNGRPIICNTFGIFTNCN